MTGIAPSRRRCERARRRARPTLVALLAFVAIPVSAPIQVRPSATPPPTTSSRLPDGLTSAGGAGQLVIVTSTSASSSYATLSTFEARDGHWFGVFPAMVARVGINGWLAPARRREGDGTTPEGAYPFGSFVYGNARDPGVNFPYRRLVPGDYWDENPAAGRAYNTFVHSSDTDCADNPFGGDTECLWLAREAYRFFGVINFNSPARGPYGSAIFLHVTEGATAGCVSVSLDHLVHLLHWLRPSLHPRIVLAGPVPLSHF